MQSGIPGRDYKRLDRLRNSYRKVSENTFELVERQPEVDELALLRPIETILCVLCFFGLMFFAFSVAYFFLRG